MSIGRPTKPEAKRHRHQIIVRLNDFYLSALDEKVERDGSDRAKVARKAIQEALNRDLKEKRKQPRNDDGTQMA